MLSLVLIKKPECANSYYKNPPNRIINRFFELHSVEKKMHLESESSNKAQRQLSAEPYFPEFLKSRALINDMKDIFVFLASQMFICDNSYLLSYRRNVQVTFVENPQLKITCFQNYKHWYLNPTWSSGYRCESGISIFS